MNARITRRRLVGGAAVAAGAAAVPQAEAATRRRTRVRRADVVVVGAGLAGLSAARAIVAAGHSVIVLEARNRVGGRTLNHAIGDGKVIEVGGQWIGPTQDALAGLAKDLGIGTYKTYNDGDYLYYAGGALTPYSASGPLGAVPPDLTGAIDAQAALIRLNSMAATVPLDAPWTARSAGEWDSQTFDTWMRANTLTPAGRSLISLAIEAVFACEPRDVSLLHVLFYIHSAGNEKNPGTFERLVNTAGGAQESRFAGGSQLVSIRMAQALGRRVVLKAPVRRIADPGRGRLTVEADGIRVSCR
ncbi:MAG TPA: FAD-dependent oxidoreductase, partial [Solirubrobacteraceae bacterium]